MVVDDGVNLRLDAVPDAVECLFADPELVAKAFKVSLYAEFVPRSGIAEVKAGGNSKVGFEYESKRCEDTFTARTSVCNEQAGLRGVINALGSVDELSNLENSRPHGSATAGNGGIAITIVEHL